MAYQKKSDQPVITQESPKAEAVHTLVEVVSAPTVETPKETIVTREVFVERVDEKPMLKQQKTKIPLDYVIGIRSGVQGTLGFTSPKTHYSITINEYGGRDTLTFDDLVSMRNAHVRYFKENWLFIEDTEDFSAEEIYHALGIEQYYTSILQMEDIDAVLSLDADNLRHKIENVPNGVKDTLVTRARKLMLDGSDIMDSNKKIKVIEDVFDVELIPKDI